MQLDAQLEQGAVSLRAAIAEFNATCRAYPTGIDESLADQLQDLARRNMEMNLWVRQVAEQFAQADVGQLDSPTTQAEVQPIGASADPGSPQGLGTVAADELVTRAAEADELNRAISRPPTPIPLRILAALVHPSRYSATPVSNAIRLTGTSQSKDYIDAALAKNMSVVMIVGVR